MYIYVYIYIYILVGLFEYFRPQSKYNLSAWRPRATEGAKASKLHSSLQVFRRRLRCLSCTIQFHKTQESSYRKSFLFHLTSKPRVCSCATILELGRLESKMSHNCRYDCLEPSASVWRFRLGLEHLHFGLSSLVVVGKGLPRHLHILWAHLAGAGRGPPGSC